MVTVKSGLELGKPVDGLWDAEDPKWLRLQQWARETVHKHAENEADEELLFEALGLTECEEDTE